MSEKILRRTDRQYSAAAPDASVWVSANAGTGKTRVLVDRIARLLLDGAEPHKILCLTFTKTAAAEMSERINAQLGTWAVLDDDALTQSIHALTGRAVDSELLRTARKLFARVLDVPGGLKIRTIHAFCEGLIGRFPIEAGVAPHFDVIDDRTTAQYLNDARERIVTRTQRTPGSALEHALTHLAELVNEDGFTQLMQDLTGKRERFKTMVGVLQREGSIAHVLARRAGLAHPEQSAHDILLGAVSAIDDAAMTHAAEVLAQGAKTSKQASIDIKAFLAKPPAARAQMFVETYAAIFVTQTGDPRKKLTTKGAEAADDLMRDEQARVLDILETLRARATADATIALVTVGQAVLSEYEHIKRVRAHLDYDDLIERARALLSTHDGGISWVHYKLDGGIDHILVDESQDTSPGQWEVVQNLAEDFYAGQSAHEERDDKPRTVFAVGDEKQSIYSFQGADPHEFGRMREHFQSRVVAAGQTLRAITLITSFRSTAAILTAVDRVFSQAHAQDGLTFANERVSHDSHRAGQSGLVEVWPTTKPQDKPNDSPWDAPVDYTGVASPDKRLAERIATTIKGWIDTKETLAASGRPIRPGDILILVRRRGAFAEAMVRNLKQLRIPVAGADRMVLTDQMAVMDLLAAGRFAVLPEDDLSMAEVLKSPLVGLAEDALFSLAHNRSGSLWSTLVSRRAETDDFARAHGILAHLLSRADATPPFEFYAELLRDGVRHAFMRRLGADAQDPIDEFLGAALDFERNHTPSLQGFLHWVTASSQTIKRDMETSGNEVRVMTVHGAKGLEAPVVFLTDTCKAPDGRTDSKLQWSSDANDPYLLWSPYSDQRCQAFNDAIERERIEREREYRRLLYVAMTRAADRLYVTGFEDANGPAEGSWYDLIQPVIEDLGAPITIAGETGWRYETPQTADVPEDNARTDDQRVAPLPAWAHEPAPIEPTPTNPLQPSRPPSQDPPAHGPFTDDDNQRFKRGLIIHKLLETLPALQPTVREAAARRWLSGAAGTSAHGLDPVMAEQIVSETLAVLNHPDFQDIFAPDSLAEVALSGVIGGQVASARLDRLAVSDSHVTVIDYKTNRPPPLNVEDVAETYLRQMALYRELLSRIYPEREIRCLLLWTDVPKIMTLPADVLRAYAPDDATA